MDFFFAGDGHADSHISTASTSHKRRRSVIFEHNELGMKSLTAFHAASIVPVWQLISPTMCPRKDCVAVSTMYTKMQHYQTSVQRSNM